MQFISFFYLHNRYCLSNGEPKADVKLNPRKVYLLDDSRCTKTKMNWIHLQPIRMWITIKYFSLVLLTNEYAQIFTNSLELTSSTLFFFWFSFFYLLFSFSDIFVWSFDKSTQWQGRFIQVFFICMANILFVFFFSLVWMFRFARSMKSSFNQLTLCHSPLSLSRSFRNDNRWNSNQTAQINLSTGFIIWIFCFIGRFGAWNCCVWKKTRFVTGTRASSQTNEIIFI